MAKKEMTDSQMKCSQIQQNVYISQCENSK